MEPELPGREQHQQRLPRALEVPDEALLRVPGHNALDYLVRCFVLLVSRNDLDAPLLLVGSEEGEVGQDVQQGLALRLAVAQRRVGIRRRLGARIRVWGRHDRPVRGVVLPHRNRGPGTAYRCGDGAAAAVHTGHVRCLEPGQRLGAELEEAMSG